MGENPTRSKPSQQAGREIHVQTWKQEYGAGWNKDAGRAIEPRKGYSCGRKTSIFSQFIVAWHYPFLLGEISPSIQPEYAIPFDLLKQTP